MSNQPDQDSTKVTQETIKSKALKIMSLCLEINETSKICASCSISGPSSHFSVQVYPNSGPNLGEEFYSWHTFLDPVTTLIDVEKELDAEILNLESFLKQFKS